MATITLNGNAARRAAGHAISRPSAALFGGDDVRGIVARTILSARAAGRDYTSQSRAAAAAVLSVRPDLTFGEALDAVIRLRETDTL